MIRYNQLSSLGGSKASVGRIPCPILDSRAYTQTVDQIKSIVRVSFDRNLKVIIDEHSGIMYVFMRGLTSIHFSEIDKVISRVGCSSFVKSVVEEEERISSEESRIYDPLRFSLKSGNSNDLNALGNGRIK